MAKNAHGDVCAVHGLAKVLEECSLRLPDGFQL